MSAGDAINGAMAGGYATVIAAQYFEARTSQTAAAAVMGAIAGAAAGMAAGAVGANAASAGGIVGSAIGASIRGSGDGEPGLRSPEECESPSSHYRFDGEYYYP